jgi:uncharacterized protein YfkK (UPF0435 family)
MDLAQPTVAHADHMLEKIKSRLRMASGQAMTASTIDLAKYDDLYALYTWVMSKPDYSIMEVEAIVAELGTLRKR